jgi:hypothetical protein
MTKTGRDSTTGRFLQAPEGRHQRVARGVGEPKQRMIRGRSKPRLYMAPAAAAIVSDRLGDALERVRLVGDRVKTELVLLTPSEIEELIEDALAEAAFARTRDQERVPIELVDRLLAGEHPVRVWREHRGLSLDALAGKTGLGKGYLSQIENRQRKGTVATLRKLAAALGVDLDDLAEG